MKVEETILTTLVGGGLLLFLFMPIMDSHATQLPGSGACECRVMQQPPTGDASISIPAGCLRGQQTGGSNAGTY